MYEYYEEVEEIEVDPNLSTEGLRQLGLIDTADETDNHLQQKEKYKKFSLYFSAI